MSRHRTRHMIKYSRQNVNNQLQCEFESFITNSSFMNMNIKEY